MPNQIRRLFLASNYLLTYVERDGILSKKSDVVSVVYPGAHTIFGYMFTYLFALYIYVMSGCVWSQSIT